MPPKRPSYQWEALVRKASVPTSASGKPLRSCLKKNSSYDGLLDMGEYSDDMCERQVSGPRTPSKTRSLDADADLLFGGMAMRNSSSSTSVENQSKIRIARRQRRRRRSSRQKTDVPLLGASPDTTTVKGILRTSSDPPNYKPKKSVSFSDLDRCRWNSETSLTKPGSLSRPKTDTRGNHVWDTKDEKRSGIIRTGSMDGLGRLLRQEMNRQAPSRPARRGSNEKAPPLRPTRINSWGDAEKPPRTGASGTVNVFQAAVNDLQASVRRTQLAKENNGDHKGHSLRLPQRAPSFDSSSDSTDQNPGEGYVRSRLSGAPSKGELAPTEPSRRRSAEHETARVLPTPNNPFMVQVSSFQESIKNSIYSQQTAPKKLHAPVMPSRRCSNENDRSWSTISPTNRSNVFQAKVTDFQRSLIDSMCAQQTNVSGGVEEMADHSSAA